MSEATNSLSNMHYEELKDDFTGDDSSHVIVNPSSGDDIAVAWKCFAADCAIIIPHPYVPTNMDDFAKVLYKFDDEAPSPEYMMISTGEMTHFPIDLIPAFTKKALSSKQLMIRIVSESLHANTITATFQLAGLGEELQKLKCFNSYF